MIDAILDKAHDWVLDIVLLFTALVTTPFALSRKWIYKSKNKKIVVNGDVNDE